jgi:hypothetical protein
MKKFRAESIDMKQMSNIRGGDVEITLDDVKIFQTKNSVAVSSDTKVEVSGTITIETE